MNKPFKTNLIAKAELVKRDSEQFKAIATEVQAKYGFEIKPQLDLMYVRSCLVTSGMNGNDDIFLRDEMWEGRHSPVLKPTNWQHKDKDIIGVVYSIEARDLQGNVIDFNQEKAPDVPYEFWTEAVVFKLIHGDRATEIEQRAAAGTLFVSMEAWFDDYSYALVKDNEPAKIIARNDNTAFLDGYLRANGGSGKYENVKIGRALKKITFGGFGFVDVPANKRSVIDSVISNIEFEHVPAGSDGTGCELEKLITSLFAKEQEIDMERVVANEAGNAKPAATVDAKEVAKAVAETLEAREAAKLAAEAESKAKAKAAELEKASAENAAKVITLEASVKDNEGKVTAALAVAKSRDAAIDEVVKALAGATNNTPSEIAAIDAAKDGEAAFNAKIAWIQKSLANTVAPMVKELTGLKAELATAASALREQEVKALLKDVLEDVEIETLVKAALAKSDTEYSEWLAEKELFVERIKGAKAPPFAKKEDKEAKKEETCKEEKGMASAIKILVENRRNANAKEINSGVGSGALKNPRYKIAGSESVEDVLENVTEEKKVDLTAAKGGEGNKEEENGFRALAKSLTGSVKSNKRPARAEAAFDPVE